MRKKAFRRLVLAVFLALALGAPNSAPAEELEFSGSLGAGAMVGPEFEGSNRYRVRALPVVSLDYGPAFLSMTQGLGFHLSPAPAWTASPSLRYRGARKERHSPLLKGLGDINYGVEAGGAIRWQPGPAGLALKVFQGLARVDGLTAELETSYGAALTETMKGSVSLSAMFADRGYNRRYFGITPDQSDRSGYQAYDPGAGLKHVGLSTSLGQALTQHLRLGLMAGYKRLTGPAAASPLVERGSADQFFSALTLYLSF